MRSGQDVEGVDGAEQHGAPVGVVSHRGMTTAGRWGSRNQRAMSASLKEGRANSQSR
jgi:hypothetical protein